MKVEWTFGDISEQNYKDLIDYCAETCDYCMLVYRYHTQKGLPTPVKIIKDQLSPFCVKSRSNPSWPGTPGTYATFYSYEVDFYTLTEEVKSVLYGANRLFDFDGENYPQDLAFFRGNKCFLYSVVHEGFASIVDPEKEDGIVLMNLLSNFRVHENETDDTESDCAKALIEELDKQETIKEKKPESVTETHREAFKKTKPEKHNICLKICLEIPKLANTVVELAKRIRKDGWSYDPESEMYKLSNIPVAESEYTCNISYRKQSLDFSYFDRNMSEVATCVVFVYRNADSAREEFELFKESGGIPELDPPIHYILLSGNMIVQHTVETYFRTPPITYNEYEKILRHSCTLLGIDCTLLDTSEDGSGDVKD